MCLIVSGVRRLIDSRTHPIFKRLHALCVATDTGDTIAHSRIARRRVRDDLRRGDIYPLAIEHLQM